MEQNLLYLYLAMLVFAAGGFAYGAPKYLRPRKPLYASMIVLGVGCIMIGRAYSFLRILTGLPVTGIFHAGILGTVGAFAFFFSANYGQIDSLVDGGEKELMKYRLLGIPGALLPCALYLLTLLSPANTAEKISDLIAAIPIAASSYFHVKHVFIPDVDYGVVRCQRIYNTTAYLYGILCMLEMAASAYRQETLMIVVCLLECMASGLLVPVMDRGVRKWSK